LQQKLGITTIFVTHDQEEALTMSDRVVVMNRGRVEQIGTPAEIYRCPRTLFVADFIGEANILAGRLASCESGQARFVIQPGVTFEATTDVDIHADMPAVATVRPESVHIFKREDPRAERFANRFAGIVETTTYLGSRTTVSVRIDPAVTLRVVQQSREPHQANADHVPQQGETVAIAWAAESCRVIRSP
jgi:ABC-type Fe3+/spermidine/putrescine transport system ATPase subunit